MTRIGYRIYAKQDRSQQDCDLRELMNRRNRAQRQGVSEAYLATMDERIAEQRAEVVRIHGSEVAAR